MRLHRKYLCFNRNGHRWTSSHPSRIKHQSYRRPKIGTVGIVYVLDQPRRPWKCEYRLHILYIYQQASVSIEHIPTMEKTSHSADIRKQYKLCGDFEQLLRCPLQAAKASQRKGQTTTNSHLEPAGGSSKVPDRKPGTALGSFH